MAGSRLVHKALLLAPCLVLCARAQAQSIVTIAGGGTDDGRPATVATLDQPGGVALDAFGNLYIADAMNARIRKVTATTGVITTVAGGRNFGVSGDGGPATAASFAVPVAVALDGSGNLYIAEIGVHRVRKVTATTGIITTVAGGLVSGFSGDGGPATAAALRSPTGLAVDGSGNLYIADSDNHRVRKVTVATGIITTVVGGGVGGDGGPATAALLASPEGVALDSSGNLYIAENGRDRVRRVTAATGIITTVAGGGFFSGDGGPATAASILNPAGLVLDGSANLYIAEIGGHRIRKVTAATGVITTVAGGYLGFSGDGGPATAASLFAPYGVALDGTGNLYIGDSGNDRIRKVTAVTGIITTVAGSGAQGFSGDGGPATAALLNFPRGVVLEGTGSLYIADTFKNRIRKVTLGTGIITTVVGGGGGGDGGPATKVSLAGPEGVALDTAGNLYVADTGNDCIRKVTAASGIITTVAGSDPQGFSGDGGPATAASLNHPKAVALDQSGDLYIADSWNDRIRKVTAATGIITTVAGSGTRGFTGDGGPATAASLNNPGAVALDESGNLYIADSGNDRIRKVTIATGTITTVAGNGTQGFTGDGGPATTASLFSPYDVVLDGSGNLYIADTLNLRIRRVTTATGIISTVVGSGGLQGFSGDGGPAMAAKLGLPGGVAIDESGNLYIADINNNRIRAVFACVTVGSSQLSSPADLSAGLSTSPMLAWNPVPGAFRYDIYLDTVKPPEQVIASDIAALTFSPSNLEPLTRYYWQVVAKGDPFCVPFSTNASAIRSFVTAGSCTAPAVFNAP